MLDLFSFVFKFPHNCLYASSRKSVFMFDSLTGNSNSSFSKEIFCMAALSRPRWWVLVAFLMTLVLTFTLSTGAFASVRASSLFQISSDPYTNSTSQHQTEVEPDSYFNGSTIVSATQVGRFADGGASNVGWATSTDKGTTWHSGFLPDTTIYATPPGNYDRLSDPSVNYDAAHQRWMISTLAISDS